jgi:hypothetical protein
MGNQVGGPGSSLMNNSHVLILSKDSKNITGRQE